MTPDSTMPQDLDREPDTTPTGGADRTSGSPQRPPHDLGATVRALVIPAVIERLRREPAFATDGRNAQTILHDGSARVIVTALDAGREVGSETSDGPVVLMILEGEGTLAQAGQQSRLVEGSLVTLAPGSGWSFTADAPTAMVACFWQPA